jgi:hypothetical protein
MADFRVNVRIEDAHKQQGEGTPAYEARVVDYVAHLHESIEALSGALMECAYLAKNGSASEKFAKWGDAYGVDLRYQGTLESQRKATEYAAELAARKAHLKHGAPE